MTPKETPLSGAHGGPAFPNECATTVHGRAGMSLRDYFATHCELGDPDNYSVQFGESLLGRLLPALGRVEQLTWWADYRAAMRYLEADAMLRASEKGGAA